MININLKKYQQYLNLYDIIIIINLSLKNIMTIELNQKELISIEINKDDKKKLERIAFVKGISLEKYLLEVACKEAQKIENSLITEEINLSEADWEIVISAIENPTEINHKLKQAIEGYKKQY